MLLAFALNAESAEPILRTESPSAVIPDILAKKAKAPPTAATYNSRGLDKQLKGDFDGAISEYDKALAADPNYAVAFFNRGNVRHARGEFEAALPDYDRAIATATA